MFIDKEGWIDSVCPSIHPPPEKPFICIPVEIQGRKRMLADKINFKEGKNLLRRIRERKLILKGRGRGKDDDDDDDDNDAAVAGG